MEVVKRFQYLTKKARNIVISTHLQPDADGIGSEVALCLAFKQLGIKAICVHEEQLQERYKYLDPENMIMSHKKYLEKYPKREIDLFIVCDTNSLARVGAKIEQLAQKANNILFIDHHPCAKELTAIHCIDTSVAATGELVGHLIKSLGIKITKELALPLYTAIIIDTSSFRYPTVTGKTHRLIAELIDTGIKPQTAYNQIYGTKQISHMQLLGTVLSSSQVTEDGTIAWLTLSEKSLEKFNVDYEDTYAFINHLLVLDNVKIACMFREEEKFVRVSFRSTGEVDVGILAQALGGGGHNHSAATVIEGTLKTVSKNVIAKLELMLKEKD
jgi:phosphoesterase RecJ-like protein